MYVTIITSWRSYEDSWYWKISMHQVFFWKKMYEQHKNIYQHGDKCDDQQNLQDVIDANMVSTP